jgi:hypothetical protein
MSASENENGIDRADLLQRVELMEQMITEGRRSTCEHGWISLLWGVVCLVPMGWQYLQQNSHWVGKWAWPVCLLFGWVLTMLGMKLQQKGRPVCRSTTSRSMGAVWGVMGAAMGIYVLSAILSHHSWQVSYLAGILLILGMAHATSAAILRWRAQAAVAAFYWAGAISMFCNPPAQWIATIFVAEICIGGIVFGLYSMVMERRERRERGDRVQHA